MKILNYELVELAVTASLAVTAFPFKPQPTLTSTDENGDIGIRGIEIFTIDSVALAPSGAAVASFAQVQNAVLNIQYLKGRKGINKIPLLKLLHLQNASAGYFAQDSQDEFDDLEIDWVNSNISVPVALGVFTAFSYLIGFSYGAYSRGSLAQIKAARGGGK